MSASFEDNCNNRHSPDDGVLEKSLVRAMKLCSRSEKCSSQIRQYLQRLSFTSRKGRCRYEHTGCEESAQASCSSGTAGIRRLEPEEIELVLKRLEEEGFVDDRRFALAYARDKMRFSKWGRVKVRSNLRGLGIDERTVEEAIANAVNSCGKDTVPETLESLNLRKLIERKLAVLQKGIDLKTFDFEQKQKLFAKIYRFALARGYEYNDIRTELVRMFQI